MASETDSSKSQEHLQNLLDALKTGNDAIQEYQQSWSEATDSDKQKVADIMDMTVTEIDYLMTHTDEATASIQQLATSIAEMDLENIQNANEITKELAEAIQNAGESAAGFLSNTSDTIEDLQLLNIERAAIEYLQSDEANDNSEYTEAVKEWLANRLGITADMLDEEFGMGKAAEAIQERVEATQEGFQVLLELIEELVGITADDDSVEEFLDDIIDGTIQASEQARDLAE